MPSVPSLNIDRSQKPSGINISCSYCTLVYCILQCCIGRQVHQVTINQDYNALLTGLPACVVKPLQMIQNAAVRLVFNQPKRAHVTPLLIELHWLPVAARIKFKSLMLAYRVIAGSAPIYLNALVRANVTPRMLRSSNERRLALPTVQVRQSILFSFVVPRWWNELPSTTRAGASLSTFKKLLKTQLFREHLLS